MASHQESAKSAYHRHDSGFSSSSDDPQCDSVEEVDGETLETGAIRKVYDDLSNEVSHQLGAVSTALYSCELIERTQLDQIHEVSGNTDHFKSVKLLNSVLTKMESAPGKFSAFLQTLEKCGCQEISEKIREGKNSPARACAFFNKFVANSVSCLLIKQAIIIWS